MSPRGRPLTVSDDELLLAARDVFVARGLDATTAEIARRARISESVIFYRYKTKEALFSAVFEQQLVVPPAFARLTSRIGKGEIADNLFDAGMALVDLMERVLPFIMMSFSSTKMSLLQAHAHKSQPMKRKMIRVMSSFFEGEMRGGRLRVVESEILARTFLGGITQYVMAEHVEGDSNPLGIPGFLRGMIDVLLFGTLVEARAARAVKTRRGR
jgi:AcrR family transcriptional regulator